MEKVFFVDPIPKPRMTKRDKWKKRPIVERYNHFKDLISLQRGQFSFPQHSAKVWFQIPMPKSWSEKKKSEMNRSPHRQKPDVDNLLKALLDALLVEDCIIWNIEITKGWSYIGKIIIKF